MQLIGSTNTAADTWPWHVNDISICETNIYSINHLKPSG